jgi:diguanylate cyclase (GGDEF)-like protein
MFDLDFFKEVNDKYGHLLGDKALQNIAKVVGENIRKTDVFCRFGGEEFLILCPGVSATEAALIAEKLRNKIEESDSPDYGQLTASFGVMQFEGEETTTQLLSGVDKALYLAKSGGRNRVVLYPRSAR